MIRPVLVTCAALICITATLNGRAAEAGRRTVIFDEAVTSVTRPPSGLATVEGDLWVTLADLKRATGYVVKPQGICRDELCFPIPRGRKQAFLNRQGRTTWFNLSEFARLVAQPVAYDAEQATWYFGPRPQEQNAFVDSLNAPDFSLP
ncbi:MAG TPA: redoxin domain-containing (seleno)protein, partial [Blastocatellia bacterium]|nr:redoxin domain-containing (seleno)protein [Blastocatellia bacterium]